MRTAATCRSRKWNSRWPSSRARSEWIRCSNMETATQKTSKKMKTKMFNKIVNTILLAGVCEIGLAIVPPAINLASAQEAANAAVESRPKVIEISAKKFEFTPTEITVNES